MFKGTYGYEIRKPIHDALAIIQEYINSENLTIECTTNQYSTWESNLKILPSYRYLITDDLLRHIPEDKKHDICNVLADAYYNGDSFKCFVMASAYGFIRPLCNERFVTVAELDASHEPTGVTYEFSTVSEANDFLEYTPEDCLIHVGGSTGIREIETEAFKDSENLYDIELPPNITRIGENAFQGTSWLTRKRASDTMVMINDILVDGQAASDDEIVPSGTRMIADGAFKNNTSLETIKMNSRLSEICQDAFYGCSNLISVKLPSELKVIGERAFMGCRISAITVPGGVETISEDSFKNCLFLEYLEISPGTITVYDSAFYNCDRLEVIKISNTVETIGSLVFYREFGDVHQYIDINKPKNSITGSPWGAINYTITWR